MNCNIKPSCVPKLEKLYPNFLSLSSALERVNSANEFLKPFKITKDFQMVDKILLTMFYYSLQAPSDLAINRAIEKVEFLFKKHCSDISNTCLMSSRFITLNYFKGFCFDVFKKPEKIKNYLFVDSIHLRYKHIFAWCELAEKSVKCLPEDFNSSIFEFLIKEVQFFNEFIDYISCFDFLSVKKKFLKDNYKVFLSDLYDITETLESDKKKLKSADWIRFLSEGKRSYITVNASCFSSTVKVQSLKKKLKDDNLIKYFECIEIYIEFSILLKKEVDRNQIKKIAGPIISLMKHQKSFDNNHLFIVSPFLMNVISLINNDVSFIYKNIFYYCFDRNKDFIDLFIEMFEIIYRNQKDLFNYIKDLSNNSSNIYYPEIKNRNYIASPLAAKEIKHKKKNKQKKVKVIKPETDGKLKQAVKAVTKNVELIKDGIRMVQADKPSREVPINQLMNSTFANWKKQTVIGHATAPLITGLPGIPFCFQKEARVRAWDLHPFGTPLLFEDYQDSSLDKQIIKHLFHAPHPLIDRFLHFGLSGSHEKTNQVDRTIEVLVVIEFQGQTYQGAVKYTFGEKDNTCYHRYFDSKLSEQHQIIFNKKLVNSTDSGKRVFIEVYKTWFIENDTAIILDDEERKVRIKLLK